VAMVSALSRVHQLGTNKHFTSSKHLQDVCLVLLGCVNPYRVMLKIVELFTTSPCSFLRMSSHEAGGWHISSTGIGYSEIAA
jgi:hypothetical protein